MSRRICVIGFIALMICWASAIEGKQSPGKLISATEALRAAWPKHAEGFTQPRVHEMRSQCDSLRRTAIEMVESSWRTPPEQLLLDTRSMVIARQGVERLLGHAFEQRLLFHTQDAPKQTRWVQQYLQATTDLIALSGRIHEACSELVRIGTIRLARLPKQRVQLIRLLAESKSNCGAKALSWLLLDPPAAAKIEPLSSTSKAAILTLIQNTQQVNALAAVTEFLARQESSADLTLQAVQTVLAIGIPQVPSAKQSDDLPEPELLAEDLLFVLDQFSDEQLNPTQRTGREMLRQEIIARQQATSKEYRVGKLLLKPGDWLLIRNPSPYNLFSTLSPGLFTHIGILTTQLGEDGKPRLVVTEMRERGSKIPATNVEAYLKRTLHYVVLRHRDPKVCQLMATTAAEVIGNPAQFDLTFQIERMNSLKGQPLAGRKIDTYCAGFLWLCAQPTNLPREAFFPLPETPYNEQTVENLHRLGMNVGKELITPTGALFSPQMQLVGRCEALYSPSKQIEQAIFDAFGEAMLEQEVVPNPSWYQALRLDLAQAAEANPLLAQAMASAANVHEETDLISAAKAAAIVESLDEIAFGKSRVFRDTWDAFLAGPEASLAQRGRTQQQIAVIKNRRLKHARLWEAFQERKITLFDLREQLVNHYLKEGRQEVLQRFFVVTSKPQQDEKVLAK